MTADDGYQAQRSYSIASAPEDDDLTITVERLDGGEVSPYLFDDARRGVGVEIRGSIGGYFVWEGDLSERPVQLIAGGSGIVPFRSMLRHHEATNSAAPVRVLYSARSLEQLIYRDEMMRIAARAPIDLSVPLTRDAPTGWHGFRRRIDMSMITATAWPPETEPLVYACGPTAFVETAAAALLDLGHD